MLPRNTPLTVGVSGHRDLHLDSVSHLRSAVTAFLQQLKELMPDTELRIIVGMAEGADLLSAEVALKLGLRVEAVLPMPFEHYVSDFDADNLELLKRLLQHASVSTVELPLPSTAPDTPLTQAERDMMYAKLAEELTRRSSLLLALWDGEASPLPGGTADTVLRYLGARTEENAHDASLTLVDADIDSDLAIRAIYWIPVARVSGRGPAEPGSPCFLSGLGENMLQRRAAMPAELRHQLTELNRYNREFQQLSEDASLGIPDSLLNALPADAPLQNRARLEQIDLQYGKADALAVYYQRRSDRLFKFFSIMTLVMGFAYLAYEKLSQSNLLLFLYLLVFISSLGLYLLLQNKHWFAKHLIYRVLAETMRTRFYLTLAHADHLVRVDEVISMSGISQFHGFSWIGHALTSVESVHDHPAVVGGFQQSRHIEHAWIERQQNYFTAKIATLERDSRRVARLRSLLFIVILAVLLILIIFEHYMERTELIGHVSWSHMLTFFMGLVTVLLGVWELYQNKMATRELLWQYRNQLKHFSRAKAQLSRVAALSRRKQIFAELGKDSLMESYLWMIHRYHREHEPPTKA